MVLGFRSIQIKARDCEPLIVYMFYEKLQFQFLDDA